MAVIYDGWKRLRESQKTTVMESEWKKKTIKLILRYELRED